MVSWYRPDGEIDLVDLRSRFLEESEPHFRYIWESFSEDERSWARRVATNRSVPESLRHVVEELGRKGYVVADGRSHSLFSSVSEEFVRGQDRREKKQGILNRFLRPR